MANLPTDGGSAGTWGAELNAYLAVGHAADGTHNEVGLARQVVNTQVVAMSTGTTQIPDDDTIPQKTEGDQYLSLAITPKSATNILIIEACLYWAETANDACTFALFQDDTTSAIFACQDNPSYSYVAPAATYLRYQMVAGTIIETTFTVRAGVGVAHTFTLNGSSGARKLGGVMASSMTITEIQV